MSHNTAIQHDPFDVDTTRPTDPNVLQRRASDPDHNVWVGASAGTGKTKVLTDRVLRLLLPRKDGAAGTQAAKILCITYTKAAAAEMSNRIRERLSRWAVSDNESLHDDLERLNGYAPTPLQVQEARRLFAYVIDVPGGLKIMTIHAFCQSVLGRFPLEAGLPPHFEIIEERQAEQLLQQTRNTVIKSIRDGDMKMLQTDLSKLAQAQDESRLTQVIRLLLGRRRALGRLLQHYGGMDDMLCAIYDRAGLVPFASPDDVLRAACSDPAIDETGLRYACSVLATGSQGDIGRADTIQDWLDNVDLRIDMFADYKKVFITNDNAVRKTLVTKKIAGDYDKACATMLREAERIRAAYKNIVTARMLEQTACLLRVTYQILQAYTEAKASRAVLDFDDLIEYTRALLAGETCHDLEHVAAWVLYKLDGGIEHILVDEAQATNPDQWDVITILAREFYAGHGLHEDRTRTLFVVGDEKQSIYSFQRADPKKFDEMRRYFENETRNAQQHWTEIALQVSFRSTKSVLGFVDYLFAEPQCKTGVTQDIDTRIKHEIWRRGEAGLVELWPLIEQKATEKPDPWEPPIVVKDVKSAKDVLAEKIARQVAKWISTGEILESKGRPIRPGDIMILLRTRGALVKHLMLALKKHKVPVSGVDRMVLREQIAVMDLLAFAEFILMPDNDLALATVLKTPLIGLCDADLLALCYGRAGSVWDALQNSESPEYRDIAVYLKGVIDTACARHPYELFSALMSCPCPADDLSGRRAIYKRLGEDALDPLDEFLNAALEFEYDGHISLQNFVYWMRQSDQPIKREMEDGRNVVRIMTVHGAKGLQSPIVFMPDTTLNANSLKLDTVLWDEGKAGFALPFWAPNATYQDDHFSMLKDKHSQAQDEEYRRLLYVAMTRAEDRLYVCGYQGKRGVLPNSWYELIRKAMENHDDTDTLSNNVRRLRNRQNKLTEGGPEKARDKREAHMVMPDWACKKAKQEAYPVAPLAPSKLVEQGPAAISPLQSVQTKRFRRGNITHKLMQYLPDIPDAERENAARSYVARQAPDISQPVQDSIVNEVMAVLRDPDYAPFFGQNSKAEVPVIGRVALDGQDEPAAISGQIDRLCVTDDTIWIIDYKTNRPPPENEADIPQSYRRQLAAYRALIRDIYPDKSICTALLWTDGPRLMIVEPGISDSPALT